MRDRMMALVDAARAVITRYGENGAFMASDEAKSLRAALAAVEEERGAGRWYAERIGENGLPEVDGYVGDVYVAANGSRVGTRILYFWRGSFDGGPFDTLDAAKQAAEKAAGR